MRQFVFLAIAVIFLSCGTTDQQPEMADVKVDSSNFKFDADYYGENAQRYYNENKYFEARDQFQKQLKLEPDSWAAAAGQAYCFYHIGRNFAVQGRLREAHRSLAEAEAIFTRTWNGEIEENTRSKEAHQWKLALGLAMTERAIANLDTVKMRQLNVKVLDPNEEKGVAARQELDQVTRHRLDYYKKAGERLGRLTRMKFASPDAFLSLGEVLFILHDDKGAEKAFLDYLDLARNSIEFWEKQRYAAAETFSTRRDRQQTDAAITARLEGATAKTVNVLRRLAEIKFNRQDYASSLSHLTEAMKLAPANYQLHVPIAESHQGLRNYKEALTHIDLYIKSRSGFDDNTRKAYRLRSQLLKHLGMTEK